MRSLFPVTPPGSPGVPLLASPSRGEGRGRGGTVRRPFGSRSVAAWVLVWLPAVLACLLQGCAGVPAEEREKAVAVWNLENLSMGDASRPDLGELLSSEIMQTVKDKAGLPVVEREKLVTVLEELNLGSSALADESTRLKVGRMIGAREMVFGSYMAVGPTVRIDLRRVDVETGAVIRAASREAGAGDPAAWLEAVRSATAELYGST